MPLATGLAPTHHRRWGVRLRPPRPDEPRGWYDDFLARWTAYLETLVCPPGSRPMSAVTTEQLARVRPGVQRAAVPGAGNEAEQSTSSVNTVGTEVPHGSRGRTALTTPAQKRRRTVGPGRPSPGLPSATADSPSPGGLPVTPPAVDTPAQSRCRQRPQEDTAVAGRPKPRQHTLLCCVRSPMTQDEDEEAAAHPDQAAARQGRAPQGAPT